MPRRLLRAREGRVRRGYHAQRIDERVTRGRVRVQARVRRGHVRGPDDLIERRRGHGGGNFEPRRVGVCQVRRRRRRGGERADDQVLARGWAPGGADEKGRLAFSFG